MYKITSGASYDFNDNVRVIVVLTPKHQTDGATNLSIQVGKANYRFESKDEEAQAATMLRALVENINVRIPQIWSDTSGIVDGEPFYMTIECGDNRLHFDWFGASPPEWVGVEDLAIAIGEVAQALVHRQGPQQPTDNPR